ncbi:enoyl-CoA hydratase family protein [Actinacidiphila bryophytorum]|uniref:Methylglutaconyl-CoA hydratase n=1 Tax=Actinacidiphila bryophytorum TaxID=1436133 RepID=A0A9W4H5A9_9ACTN|nr:enoyl-CoA hydratase family protein [Actinacidiphila bryophytorum]MBM9439654.1 enoyl-CoA hydratase family protein [Actinacidiphila bryophytorum]MBN6542992.1 enoyl-CoA hydratase family protein [Actinacidiphila bryophytorum]CAG7653139.1 Methylglutaconyl-CoA hydratase [Actinacidiphila bryophytorum]
MTDAPLVRRHTDLAVAVLTLDSPHNRNALSAALIAQLTEALDAADADPQVRAVLLTHTGSTFCAGADLKAGGIRSGPRLLVELITRIATLTKPVVARADGHVRAGGLGLLAACDIPLAGSAATFAFTEVRLGLAAAVASLPVLVRADPRAAARYLLTGEAFDTAEAVRIGLVTAHAEALDGILAGLRASSPQGLAATKEITTAQLRERIAATSAGLEQQSIALFESADAAEGIKAALERRDPPWAI